MFHSISSLAILFARIKVVAQNILNGIVLLENAVMFISFNVIEITQNVSCVGLFEYCGVIKDI